MCVCLALFIRSFITETHVLLESRSERLDSDIKVCVTFINKTLQICTFHRKRCCYYVIRKIFCYLDTWMWLRFFRCCLASFTHRSYYLWLKFSKLASPICFCFYLFISLYSRTSIARTPLGPCKSVRAMSSSSQWRLIMAPGQEANSDNLGKSFRVSTQ